MSLFVRLSVADRKNTDKTYLLIHLIWVAIPLILVTIFVPSIWGISLLILLSHSIIDFGKPHVANSFKLNPLVTFLLDQMLHLGIILLLAPLAKGVVLPNILTREVLNIILFIVLITKPTNVFFKIFFQKYQPESSQKWIPFQVLEQRLDFWNVLCVMSICIIFNQFASIGLVFTAKSIARYNKISESPTFAEYYLIGSLFSILSVLLSAWICLF